MGIHMGLTAWSLELQTSSIDKFGILFLIWRELLQAILWQRYTSQHLKLQVSKIVCSGWVMQPMLSILAYLLNLASGIISMPTFLFNTISGKISNLIIIGSGGFMADLVFNGGVDGAILGNQQFTVRNLTFNNVITAIYQIWDWGWYVKFLY